MSVSPAPVRLPEPFVAARGLRADGADCAANDNHDDRAHSADLEAALRHFALHGLGAASAAYAEAEAHWQRGDRIAAELSLAICRAFDRRLARELESRLRGNASAKA